MITLQELKAGDRWTFWTNNCMSHMVETILGDAIVERTVEAKNHIVYVVERIPGGTTVNTLEYFWRNYPSFAKRIKVIDKIKK